MKSVNYIIYYFTVEFNRYFLNIETSEVIDINNYVIWGNQWCRRTNAWCTIINGVGEPIKLNNREITSTCIVKSDTGIVSVIQSSKTTSIKIILTCYFLVAGK